MTNMWDETEGTNTISPTSVTYAPAQETTVQPQTTQSTSEPNLKKDLIEKIQSSMAGLPISPSILASIDNMSEAELHGMSQAAPQLARDVQAAANGEEVSTNIPGAQAMVDAVKKQHDDTKAFEKAAFGTLAVPLTATAAAGAYTTAGLFSPSGEEESKTIPDTAAKTTAVNASEVNSMVSMGTGFKEIFSKASESMSKMFAGLSSGSKETLESIKSGWQNMMAKTGMGNHEQGADVSLASLGGLSSNAPGGKQQAIAPSLPYAGGRSLN